MKIIVCVKVVKGEINPFDESALECALKLSDDVTVVSMGPVSCLEVLKPLTRLGAKVKLICDSAYAGSDTLATSYILSTATKHPGKHRSHLCSITVNRLSSAKDKVIIKFIYER